jgi:neprilysin
MTNEERRDVKKLYNPRTIEQLQIDFPYNDWLTYFNNLLPPESQVQYNETVVVGDLMFFVKLAGLLKSTSKRTLANYIAWRQVDDSMRYLPKVFKDRKLEFNKIRYGLSEPTPRWETCISEALDVFPFALSGLYIRKHFKKEAKAKALEMVENIKSEFKIILRENTWMDAITKKAATKKIEAIYEVIGYPDGLTKDVNIVKYYSRLNVTVNETLYYETILALVSAITKQSNEKLRLPVNKKAWLAGLNPAVVNAAYSSWDNAIHFPAAMLQGVFFNAERPQYMNYGGIGLVIGHEITHGNRLNINSCLRFDIV